MIITEIASYMKTNRRVNLHELAQHFMVDPLALQGMLAVLERSGRIHKLSQSTACKGCCQCAPDLIEIYEWTEVNKNIK